MTISGSCESSLWAVPWQVALSTSSLQLWRPVANATGTTIWHPDPGRKPQASDEEPSLPPPSIAGPGPECGVEVRPLLVEEANPVILFLPPTHSRLRSGWQVTSSTRILPLFVQSPCPLVFTSQWWRYFSNFSRSPLVSSSCSFLETRWFRKPDCERGVWKRYFTQQIQKKSQTKNFSHPREHYVPLCGRPWRQCRCVSGNWEGRDVRLSQKLSDWKVDVSAQKWMRMMGEFLCTTFKERWEIQKQSCGRQPCGEGACLLQEKKQYVFEHHSDACSLFDDRFFLLMHCMDQTGIFEFCDNTTKRQCSACNSFSEIGFFCCSCVRNLKCQRSPTTFRLG